MPEALVPATMPEAAAPTPHTNALPVELMEKVVPSLRCLADVLEFAKLYKAARFFIDRWLIEKFGAPLVCFEVAAKRRSKDWLESEVFWTRRKTDPKICVLCCNMGVPTNRAHESPKICFDCCKGRFGGAFELITERSLKDRHLVTLEAIPPNSKTARNKNYFILGDKSQLLAVAWPHEVPPPKNADPTRPVPAVPDSDSQQQKKTLPEENVADAAAKATEAEAANLAEHLQETYDEMGLLKPRTTNLPLQYVPKIPAKPADPPKPNRLFYFNAEIFRLAARTVGGPDNLKRQKFMLRNAWGAKRDLGKVSITTKRKQEVEAEERAKKQKPCGAAGVGVSGTGAGRLAEPRKSLRPRPRS